jgi:hypothetical protein
MVNAKISEALMKAFGDEQLRNILKASLISGASPDDLLLINTVCADISIVCHVHPDACEFLDLLAGKLIELGTPPDASGGLGMGSCRGMGGPSMAKKDFKDLTEEGAKGIISICIKYNLSPNDLALIKQLCPASIGLNKATMKEMEALRKSIIKKTASKRKTLKPVPPSPPVPKAKGSKVKK